MRLSEPLQFELPEYAERHAGMFKDYKIPRKHNFNPENSSGVSWVRELPKLNQTVLPRWTITMNQRSQLRAVHIAMSRRDDRISCESSRGQRTYRHSCILYTSDDGYRISKHSLTSEKECPFEDVHIISSSAARDC